MKRIFVLLAVVAVAACIVGCNRAYLSANSVPNARFHVGGGFDVVFKARLRAWQSWLMELQKRP